MKFHPLANIFPLMEGQALVDLVKDISEHGVREPVWLFEGQILDGRNRYRAAMQCGIDCPTREYFGDDALAFVLSLNLARRHLDASQRAMIGARIATLQKGVNQHTENSAPAQAETAKTLGISPDSLQFAKKVINKAQPEIIAAVESGKLSVSQAAKLADSLPEFQRSVAHRIEVGNEKPSDAIREERRAEIVERLESVSAIEAKTTSGLYDVIVIDPPWPMKKIERDVRPNQSEFDYPTMSESELEELEIPCADDCHVWVWTTHKFLPMALRLLDVWNMKYVCTFVWHKPGGFQPIGLPQYNSEFALYARKGTPKFVDTKAFPTCFEAPRGSHSEKPQAFYDMVSRVTAGRCLDMFNRRAIDGFEVWGKEIESA